ncbi:MAG: cob(I)yrinic acid a,c-diamide adenosyltransferase [Spirochaetes bacterium]|nr:cob(I)yrinic acid a,c-diamide adenosyltransferase [Spirochaetota bacterium]
MQKGFIHLYYGYGKGKSSSITGLIIRALSHDLSMALFRFFKTREKINEDRILAKFKQCRIFYPDFSTPRFSPGIPEEDIIKDQLRLFQSAQKIAETGKYDLLILDEGLDLVKYRIITAEELIRLFRSKKQGLEMVLTGHYMNQKLKKNADVVTYFKKIKHYFDKGVQARKGIEF